MDVYNTTSSCTSQPHQRFHCMLLLLRFHLRCENQRVCPTVRAVSGMIKCLGSEMQAMSRNGRKQAKTMSDSEGLCYMSARLQSRSAERERERERTPRRRRRPQDSLVGLHRIRVLRILAKDSPIKVPSTWLRRDGPRPPRMASSLLSGGRKPVDPLTRILYSSAAAH